MRLPDLDGRDDCCCGDVGHVEHLEGARHSLKSAEARMRLPIVSAADRRVRRGPRIGQWGPDVGGFGLKLRAAGRLV